MPSRLAVAERAPFVSSVWYAARFMVRSLAYTTAAVVGLGLVPALFAMADRATVLHWSNEVLSFVGLS
jgi:hypothetical protein